MPKYFPLLFLFSLVFAACVDNGPDVSNPEAECSIDADCPVEGTVCTPRKICLPLKDPLEVPVGIEIYDHRGDSSTRGKLLMDVGPADLVPDTDGIVYITVPDPITISGTIKTTEGFVNGTVVSYRSSSIPGKEVVTSTLDVGTITPAPGVEYSFSVVQRGMYLLQVIPSPAADYAPMLKDVWASQDWEQNFTLGRETYKVRGRITDTDGVPFNGQATLFIFDWLTGHASTVETLTGDASGYFEVIFADIPSSLSIYITPTDYSSIFPADRFDVSQEALATGTVSIDGIPTFDAGTLLLQATPAPITFKTSIYGRTKSGTTEWVAGARVTFRSEVTHLSLSHGNVDPQGSGTTDATGIIVVEGTTDASGIVSVEIIPGEFTLGRIYEVTVVTPHDSPFASIKKQIEVGSSSGFGESIELENRIDVVGQITWADSGEPMSTVLVEAAISHNAEELHPETMIDANYMQTDQTDAEGWFTLRLDPGYYDFSLLFPDSYGLPYNTYTDLNITPEQGQNSTYSFSPTQPSVIRVVLLDTAGQPVRDMQVRAYAVAEECEIDDLGCEIPARLLSSYTTSADGMATLLVQSSPVD